MSKQKSKEMDWKDKISDFLELETTAEAREKKRKRDYIIFWKE